jgi:DNA-binding MarR family transcriptional regulator
VPVEYLKYFEVCPNAEMENGLPKISWNDTADKEVAVRQIIRLGQLLAHLRAVVPTRETHGTQGSDYSYDIPTIEEPGRAITQLRNLASGHALSTGRNYITLEDIPIVIKVVLSTASIERSTIFDILIANKGSLTTSEITASLNITAHTAHRTMTELSALGLVDVSKLTDKQNSEKKITLKDEFSWFLSEEFQALRESLDSEGERQQPLQKQEVETELEEKDTITSQKNESDDPVAGVDELNGGKEHEEKSPPTSSNLTYDNSNDKEKTPISQSKQDDNSSSDNNNSPCSVDKSPNQSLESQTPEIKFTPDYKVGKPIFLRIFKELANDNNGLVAFDKLQDRLVSTGKFYVGEAVLMIQHMEKIGKIEKTEHYNIYRIKDSVSPNVEWYDNNNLSCVQI